MNWKMKNGEKIAINKMGDNHLKNAIKMLERNAEKGGAYFSVIDDGKGNIGDVEGYLFGDEYLKRTQYYGLVNEAKERGLIY